MGLFDYTGLFKEDAEEAFIEQENRKLKEEADAELAAQKAEEAKLAPPDFSKISNPKVRKYMEDKYAKEQSVVEAKDKRDIGAYGDIAGRFLEGMNQPTNIRYENSFKNLGATPKRSVGEAFKYDDGGAKDLIEKGVKEAEGDLAKVKTDFNDKVAMDNYAASAADSAENNDPNSEVSKQYQALAKELMPSGDFSNVSAAKLTKIMPPLEKLYQHRNKPKAEAQATWISTGMVDDEGYLILNNRFSGENKRGLKVGKKPGSEKGEPAPKPMNEGEMQRFDNIRMGMTALQDAEAALAGGDNTFSVIGSNKYTEAATRFEEALGRMQSGGAIQKDEADRFRGMLPKAFDSAEIKRIKLANMNKEFAARLKTLQASGKSMPEIKSGSTTPSNTDKTFDWEE